MAYGFGSVSFDAFIFFSSGLVSVVTTGPIVAHDVVKQNYMERIMRKVEIYTAGCPVCTDVVELVRQIGCPSCEISVLDTHDKDIATRAGSLGIHQVPAVVVNGNLIQGIDEQSLRAAGIGQPE
jgi:glutaredoxin 3